MTEIVDLYATIAPAAFAKFGADPVPFVVAPEGWYTPPNEWDALLAILGRGNTAVAETGFVPFEDIPTFGGRIANDARPVYLSFNPYFLPGLYEDEVYSVLLHEIAHAAGVWEDQHSDTWRRRALVFGTAPAELYFTQRDWSANPYYGDDPAPHPPTVDVLTLALP